MVYPKSKNVFLWKIMHFWYMMVYIISVILLMIFFYATSNYIKLNIWEFINYTVYSFSLKKLIWWTRFSLIGVTVGNLIWTFLFKRLNQIKPLQIDCFYIFCHVLLWLFNISFDLFFSAILCILFLSFYYYTWVYSDQFPCLCSFYHILVAIFSCLPQVSVVFCTFQNNVISLYNILMTIRAKLSD